MRPGKALRLWDLGEAQEIAAFSSWPLTQLRKKLGYVEVREKYFCKTNDREEQKEGMCSLQNRT